MKKYFLFHATNFFFAEVKITSMGGIDTDTTPSTILGAKILKISLVDRSTANGTTYDAVVAGLKENNYTSEAALITFAGANTLKLVSMGAENAGRAFNLA